MAGWDGSSPMLVLVFRATGLAGADTCLARREGSEGLICHCRHFYDSRSVRGAVQHSGTCLGCTPCELAPPPRSPSRGPARVARALAGPQTPHLWLFQSLLQDPLGAATARGHPSLCVPSPSPGGPALGPKPIPAGASPGLLWVEPAARAPCRASVPWAHYGPWAGVPGVEVPAVTRGETAAQLREQPPQPELPRSTQAAAPCRARVGPTRASPGPGWTG